LLATAPSAARLALRRRQTLPASRAGDKAPLAHFQTEGLPSA
jgi:hypothetical protein